MKDSDRFRYEDAINLYNRGDYITAMESFALLQDYERSRSYASSCVHDYLFGTWVNEELSIYIEIDNNYTWTGETSGTALYYGGTGVFSGTPSKYNLKRFDFGYDDSNSFAVIIIAQNSDGEEVHFGIQNLESESFELRGKGRFIRTDQEYY